MHRANQVSKQWQQRTNQGLEGPAAQSINPNLEHPTTSAQRAKSSFQYSVHLVKARTCHDGTCNLLQIDQTQKSHDMKPSYVAMARNYVGYTDMAYLDT